MGLKEIKEFKKERFLKNNPLKKEIINILSDTPKTATEIAKELKKHRSSISRVLLELQKDKIVKCINPEDVKDRGYVKIKDY